MRLTSVRLVFANTTSSPQCTSLIRPNHRNPHPSPSFTSKKGGASPGSNSSLRREREGWERERGRLEAERTETERRFVHTTHRITALEEQSAGLTSQLQLAHKGPISLLYPFGRRPTEPLGTEKEGMSGLLREAQATLVAKGEELAASRRRQAELEDQLRALGRKSERLVLLVTLQPPLTRLALGGGLQTELESAEREWTREKAGLAEKLAMATAAARDKESASSKALSEATRDLALLREQIRVRGNWLV